MADDLLQLLTDHLLPTLEPLGFRVVESHAAESFDNAFVVLESPALRVQVERERGIVVASIGPASEPNATFDSAVLMDYLGLSRDAGFHDRDARAVLAGLGAFLAAVGPELAAKFGPRQLAATKRSLDTLRERRAAERYGY